MGDRFVTRKEFTKIIGIHYQTLYNLVKAGKVEYIKKGTKQRSYNVDKYIRDNNIKISNKKRICYCRVSSQKQKEDLERQIEFMKKKYPSYIIITDIASGLNFKREGLNKIINIAIDGELEELVIAYKDRLARFGYDMIEGIIKTYSSGKITIVNDDEEKTGEEELVEDVLAIMNVFVAKRNGLRKYKKKLKEEIIKKN